MKKETWFKVGGIVALLVGAVGFKLTTGLLGLVVTAVIFGAGLFAIMFGSGVKASDVVKSATDAAADIEAVTKKK